MKNCTRYLGLDVHAETITAAIAQHETAGELIIGLAGSFHINGLPFSSKPAAESASRFYTDAPAAGLPAATAWLASLASYNDFMID